VPPDPAGLVVICADTSNVDSVFVAGKAVKREGQLVGVDLSRGLRLVEESRDYLLGKAVQLVTGTGPSLAWLQ